MIDMKYSTKVKRPELTSSLTPICTTSLTKIVGRSNLAEEIQFLGYYVIQLCRRQLH